jgi:hypothetical protein
MLVGYIASQLNLIPIAGPQFIPDALGNQYGEIGNNIF